MKPYFLNTDLLVRSRRSLAAFIREMSAKTSLLSDSISDGKSRGSHYANIELRARYSCEGIMKAFCRIIEGLPRDAAKEWREASSRIFDIGLQSGNEHPTYTLDISPETLTRIAKLNAGIVVTLYPVTPETPSI